MAGAFTINGLIPGPLLFRDNPDVAWTIIASLLVGNLILLILNVPLARVWIAMLKMPFHYLMAAILAFMFLGTYSHQRQHLRHHGHARRRRDRLHLPPAQGPADSAGARR